MLKAGSWDCEFCLLRSCSAELKKFMGMHLKQNELFLQVLMLLVHESDLLYLVAWKGKFAGSLFGNVK